MIRVTAELLSAITGRTSTLGVTYISNDGDGTRERGNYDVRVMRKGVTSPMGRTAREAHVEDYPRLAYNVWRLIARSLVAAFPEERITKGAETKLTGEAMRGLTLLREHYDEDGHNWLNNPNWQKEIEAACTWLDAAKAEPDHLGDALGCAMPEGDKREEFQRSIFRGLKLIGSEHRDQRVGTDVERADMANALKFIEALPT